MSKADLPHVKGALTHLEANCLEGEEPPREVPSLSGAVSKDNYDLVDIFFWELHLFIIIIKFSRRRAWAPQGTRLNEVIGSLKVK